VFVFLPDVEETITILQPDLFLITVARCGISLLPLFEKLLLRKVSAELKRIPFSFYLFLC